MKNRLRLGFVFLLLFVVLTSFVSATAPSGDNTLAYWAMENATDLTGDYNLTVSGATSGIPAILNNSYYFDGSSNYMTSSLDFNSANSFSVSIWFRTNDTGGRLINQWNGGGTGESSWKIDLVSSVLTMDVYSPGSGTQSFSTSTVVNDDSWHHAVMVYNGTSGSGDLYVYLDNVSKNSSSVTIQDSTVRDVRLGTQSGGTLLPFQGQLDEVAVFNTALTSANVDYLYASGSPSSAQQHPYVSADAPTIVSSLPLKTNNFGRTDLSVDFNITSCTNGIYYEWYVNDTLNGSAKDYTFDCSAHGSGLYNVTGYCLNVDNSSNDSISFNLEVFGDDSFTIIQIPDTQNTIANDVDQWYNISQWIYDTKEELNIQWVQHVGDMVNLGSSTSQWNSFNTGLDIFENDVPFGLAIGNHDLQDGTGHTTRAATTYESYFNTSYWLNYNYYQSYYPDTRSNYWFWNAEGYEFMTISLRWCPTQSDVDWAKGLANSNPNKRILYTSHSFLGSYDNLVNSSYNHSCAVYSANSDGLEGQNVSDELITQYDNFFMTLSGHHLEDGIGYRNDTTVGGNIIQQFFFNKQDDNNGNGWLRFYVLEPSQDVIKVRTYSPFTDTFQTDNENFTSVFYNLSNITNQSVYEVGDVYDYRSSWLIDVNSSVSGVDISSDGRNFTLSDINQTFAKQVTSYIDFEDNVLDSFEVHNATLGGNATYQSTGLFDTKEIYLDGSGDYVDLGINWFDGKDKFSLSFWLTSNETDVTKSVITSRVDASFSLFLYQMSNGSLRLDYRDDGTTATRGYTDPIIENETYMVSMSYDGSNVLLWLNDSLQINYTTTDNTYNLASASEVLYLGQNPGTSSQDFNGSFDNLLIWDNYTLTQANIDDLYNSSNGILYDENYTGSEAINLYYSKNIDLSINSTYIVPVWTEYNPVNHTTTLNFSCDGGSSWTSTTTSNQSISCAGDDLQYIVDLGDNSTNATVFESLVIYYYISTPPTISGDYANITNLTNDLQFWDLTWNYSGIFDIETCYVDVNGTIFSESPEGSYCNVSINTSLDGNSPYAYIYVSDNTTTVSTNGTNYTLASIVYDKIASDTTVGNLTVQYFRKQYNLTQNIGNFSDVNFSYDSSNELTFNITTGLNNIYTIYSTNLLNVSSYDFIKDALDVYTVDGTETLFRSFNVSGNLSTGENVPSFNISLPTVVYTSGVQTVNTTCGSFNTSYTNFTSGQTINILVDSLANGSVDCYNYTFKGMPIYSNKTLNYTDVDSTRTYFFSNPDGSGYGSKISFYFDYLKTNAIDLTYNIQYGELTNWALRDSSDKQVYRFDEPSTYTLESISTDYTYTTNDSTELVTFKWPSTNAPLDGLFVNLSYIYTSSTPPVSGGGGGGGSVPISIDATCKVTIEPEFVRFAENGVRKIEIFNTGSTTYNPSIKREGNIKDYIGLTPSINLAPGQIGEYTVQYQSTDFVEGDGKFVLTDSNCGVNEILVKASVITTPTDIVKDIFTIEEDENFITNVVDVITEPLASEEQPATRSQTPFLTVGIILLMTLIIGVLLLRTPIKNTWADKKYGAASAFIFVAIAIGFILMLVIVTIFRNANFS